MHKGSLKEKISVFFATGTGLGYSPFAPGTAGTLWGIPIFYAMSKCPLEVSIAIAVICIIVSIPIASVAARVFNKKDPGAIVCDEIAGFAVTCVAIPFNLQNVILLFILFRIFDILKPYPVSFFDKKISGGTGIVLDDVMAGIYANISAQLILHYIL